MEKHTFTQTWSVQIPVASRPRRQDREFIDGVLTEEADEYYRPIKALLDGWAVAYTLDLNISEISEERDNGAILRAIRARGTLTMSTKDAARLKLAYEDEL